MTGMSGWIIDLRALYGSSWKKRERFHLREHLYESPDGSRGVLFLAIGEVGINKEVAELALFEGKDSPRLLWRSGRTLFWFEGQPGEPLEFAKDGRRARVFEHLCRWNGAFDWRERILDLDSGRLLPVPGNAWEKSPLTKPALKLQRPKLPD